MRLAKLSLIAQSGVNRLVATGITPDYDDVIALQELGWALSNPEGLPCVSVLGNPVRVGNCDLWPWSIGSERWYRLRAQDWFGDDNEFLLYSLAFSHAQSREPAILRALTNPKDALAAVEAGLEVFYTEDSVPSQADYSRTCPECMQERPDLPTKDDEGQLLDTLDESAYFDVIGRLMAAYGGTTLDYWTWTPPTAVSFRLLSTALSADDTTGGGRSAMAATHKYETGLRFIRDKHLARKRREKEAGE